MEYKGMKENKKEVLLTACFHFALRSQLNAFCISQTHNMLNPYSNKPKQFFLKLA